MIPFPEGTIFDLSLQFNPLDVAEAHRQVIKALLLCVMMWDDALTMLHLLRNKLSSRMLAQRRPSGEVRYLSPPVERLTIDTCQFMTVSAKILLLKDRTAHSRGQCVCIDDGPTGAEGRDDDDGMNNGASSPRGNDRMAILISREPSSLNSSFDVLQLLHRRESPSPSGLWYSTAPYCVYSQQTPYEPHVVSDFESGRRRVLIPAARMAWVPLHGRTLETTYCDDIHTLRKSVLSAGRAIGLTGVALRSAE